MPYCTQCGRYLFDGEKCTCTSAVQTPPPPIQGQSNAQQPYQNGFPNQYRQNSSNNAPQYPNGYPQPYQPYQYIYYPPQKKGVSWAIIFIPVILFMFIAAIIVVPAAIGYNKRAKQTSANANANALRRSCNAVLHELKEKGENINGLYFISSDSNDNVAVPFDTDDFYERLDNYFADLSNLNYFVVIRNGDTEYAAVSASWTKESDIVGSYPPGTPAGPRLYSVYGIGTAAEDNDDLDDIYWKAYDQVFRK